MTTHTPQQTEAIGYSPTQYATAKDLQHATELLTAQVVVLATHIDAVKESVRTMQWTITAVVGVGILIMAVLSFMRG